MENTRRPEQWTASSHPDLAAQKPEDLFEADFAERYARMHRALWWRINRLHGTIHTLEQLADVPFDYLYGPQDMEFWRLVVLNFLDTACLILHGLTGDKGQEVLSVPSFKNKIMKETWQDDRMRDLLAEILRQRKFDDEVASMAERVEQIRRRRIAHLLIDDRDASLKNSLADVSLQELRQLFNATHAVFGALSFGAVYPTLIGDLMPGTIGGKPTPTCLDQVLDAVLREGYFVNRPERRAQWWQFDRSQMAPEMLQVMNSLRKRIGLPEA